MRNSVVLHLSFLFVCTAIGLANDSNVSKSGSKTAVDELAAYLKKASIDDSLEKLNDLGYAKTPLTAKDAARAERLLWEFRRRQLKSELDKEWKERKLVQGKMVMPFHYTVYGKKPKGGRSLFISLHGGGGTAPRVNDSQWENQKRLYKPAEGVYVAPRAPTNTWNLWHQSHIDPLFDKLIAGMIVFEDVNPERVYVMGYSAGGDGVYQIGPRMADRWAAAAMMAGHPNDASPLSLRNTAFTIHMGGKDGAYNRNGVAKQWGEKLDALQKADPQGYEHWTKIYPQHGHWMKREDAAAVPWMAKYSRKTFPKKIVWQQDDVVGKRFYWLGTEKPVGRSRVDAEIEGQQIELKLSGASSVELRLKDGQVDMDKPLTIKLDGAQPTVVHPKRSIAAIAASLQERPDPSSVYYWKYEVSKGKDQAGG